MKLTTKQTQALDLLEDSNNGIVEVIYGGSAGSAKTVIGCYWILKSSLKYAGSRWIIGRKELKALKQTTLQTFFEVCKMQGLTVNVDYVYKEQISEIHMFNGSVILLKDLAYQPSDPDYDSLGSLEVCGIFCDEIAQIRKKCWDVLLTRIRYKLDEFGIKPKIFGSLNPSKNWVYTYFYKPFKDGLLDKSNKRFIRALPTDNPYLPDSYLELLRNLPKAERDRLYLGLWESDDSNQLCTQNAIQEIFNNSWVKTGQWYISGDIARQGSDKAVIGLWNGLKLVKVIQYAKSDFDLLKDAITTLKNDYKVPNANIILDSDGVGGFLVDALKAKEFVNNSRPLNNENYQNLKTQCYYKLAEIINNGELYVSQDVLDSSDVDLLIEELEQIKSAPSEDNKLKIISKSTVKDNIGRSPDISDMLMMRMIYEIKTGGDGIYNF
jgi:PBSX family phage terminase large subunit